jgi:ankyrin repeat protein
MDDLTRAILNCDLKALQRGIEARQDVNNTDIDGGTLLMQAVVHGGVEFVNALIAAGAKLDAQDKAGYTALHLAAQEFQPDSMKALVNAGAKIDVPDRHGNTALMKAVYYSRGRGDLIKLLLQNGADKHFKNKHGVSPMGLAESMEDDSAAQFLN